MSDRKRLIALKKEELRRTLESWARDTLHIRPGERLVFELSVTASPEEESRLFAMRIRDHLTLDHWLEAGANSKRYRRAVNALMDWNAYFGDPPVWRKAETVGDVVTTWRQFGTISPPNFGVASCFELRKVFLYDGIIVP